MKIFLGIDLGSTTSKAIIIDEHNRIIGRGITNTRANYEVAAEIARMEAEFNSRFTIVYNKLAKDDQSEIDSKNVLPQLEYRFHFLQFKSRFEKLLEKMTEQANQIKDEDLRKKILSILKESAEYIEEDTRKKFFEGKTSMTSEFFRDLFSVAYIKSIEGVNRVLFDQLIAIFDRSITPVENQMIKFDFAELTLTAIDLLPEGMQRHRSRLMKYLEEVEKISLEPKDYIGTGYGRQLLPFEQHHIKSEILCHAMGAHVYFPKTKTVLDIGGQDTKAIQVDKNGLVTSFQMNDRCAAGCGRYLGYIADEMSMSVGEIGPLAMEAEFETNICSTCTVFAGAELREHLNLGEKKENILAGLHKAIVQRAFALLARSGGVRDEFTFTGGVARNPAVIKYVSQMVKQNYGDLKINCHHDSIFMGALGAALFSVREKIR
ncbi:MAG: BadF/BadG/BcrA/BcrD ATPase family protein [Candidatus Neomarinimicrobiota bacterium]